MLQTAHATHGFTYAKALAASEKTNWRVEDIIGDERRLDFGKPFMPESLARIGGLDFLDAEARLKLNHIRANGYLYTFGLVEEFILPFVLDHARPLLAKDDLRTRALLRFASEEAKHIHLFRAFEREFEAGFGTAWRHDRAGRGGGQGGAGAPPAVGGAADPAGRMDDAAALPREHPRQPGH